MTRRQTSTHPSKTEGSERLESKVRSYARSFPAVITRALGTELWDVDGKRYLDFLAVAGSLNYGHNNPAFKQALIDYIAQDGVPPSLDPPTAAQAPFLQPMHEV